MYLIIIYILLGSISRKKLCAYLFTFVFPLKWFELHIFLHKYINFKLICVSTLHTVRQTFGTKIKTIYFIFHGKLEKVAEKENMKPR